MLHKIPFTLHYLTVDLGISLLSLEAEDVLHCTRSLPLFPAETARSLLWCWFSQLRFFVSLVRTYFFSIFTCNKIFCPIVLTLNEKINNSQLRYGWDIIINLSSFTDHRGLQCNVHCVLICSWFLSVALRKKPPRGNPPPLVLHPLMQVEAAEYVEED